jgi:beta-1,2-mannobiose phosphorylase / 1,2-beta-oligomannan phosphorylase
MIAVKKEGVLLHKTELPFENEGVLNPAAIKEGDTVHLFYRAVQEGNHSTIGYCKLKGPLDVELRYKLPVIFPEFDYESQGLEDPRIVKIDNLYYLTYTAYDGLNALGALATSTDLIHFEKQGIVVPKISYQNFARLLVLKETTEKYLYYNEHERSLQGQGKEKFLWDKNLIFFPKRIDGKLCFLHRIKPDIQILVSVENLKELNEKFWENYFLKLDTHIVLSPKFEHEKSYIGGGCPPIETAEGWLLIYHGVHDSRKGYVYSACVALLDLHNPQIEIARLPYPLFKPELVWELKGEVNNVCFPTGAVLFGDALYIYYGAADERIGTVSVSMSALLTELLLNKI